MNFFRKLLVFAMVLTVSVGIVDLGAIPTVEVRADAYSDEFKTEGDWEYRILKDGTANITSYDGDATVIEFPKSINGMTVTSIGGSSYRPLCGEKMYEQVEKVIIPDTVTRIEIAAFWGHKALKEIVIPDSVTYIDGMVFDDTKWLENQRAKSPLVIVNGILVDAQKAEGDVKIPDGVTKISPFAFLRNETVTGVEMPQSVTDIGYRAFENCTSLKRVEMSENITKIPFALFMGCKALESVNIPWRVTEIAMDAFMSCTSLEQIDIPFGVTKIGGVIGSEDDPVLCGAFNGSAIRHLTIPEGITIIDERIFGGCRMLESIKIPKSVEKIDGDIFGGYGDTDDEWVLWVENPVIYGYAGTVAETYAHEKGITFVVLDLNPSGDDTATVTVNPAAGDTAAKFEMEKNDIISLFSAILTKEQFEAAVYGKVRFDIELSVTKADSTVSDDDKELILKAVDTASKEGNTDFKIMNYFDISFGAVIDDEKVNVSETADELTISIALENPMNGEYKVVRIHDGKAEVIDAQLDKDGTRLIFKTDRFSTYAIIYADVASGENTPSLPIIAFLLAASAVIAAGVAVAIKEFKTLGEK